MKLKIPKVNWERCIHMRDVTLKRGVKELEECIFDMSDWYSETHRCGTAACAGGFAALDPGLHGLYLSSGTIMYEESMSYYALNLYFFGDSHMYDRDTYFCENQYGGRCEFWDSTAKHQTLEEAHAEWTRIMNEEIECMEGV